MKMPTGHKPTIDTFFDSVSVGAEKADPDRIKTHSGSSSGEAARSEQLSGETKPATAETPLLDTGLACFAIMASFFEKPVSVEQIRHKYDRQNSLFEEYELLALAKEFSFKARFIDSGWERLSKINLPAVAQDKSGAYFILGQCSEDKVLIQDPAAGNRPQILSKTDFLERWNGRLLMMTCREFINGKNRKFDISWFIPAIVKYRRLFGEVILASFFLQLFALVSPLLFQVVIDKVLVNRGLSSLDVLMVALICIGIFETLLGALRTYTFSHTTTRIDVELGASLFQHLIRLPLSYFGVRRVGDTVARVHELENIRNFLTGSTLTLIIDFFFTLVFFTVMFFLFQNTDTAGYSFYPVLCFAVFVFYANSAIANR